jgi:hypothetical protein
MSAKRGSFLKPSPGADRRTGGSRWLPSTESESLYASLALFALAILYALLCVQSEP